MGVPEEKAEQARYQLEEAVYRLLELGWHPRKISEEVAYIIETADE